MTLTRKEQIKKIAKALFDIDLREEDGRLEYTSKHGGVFDFGDPWMSTQLAGNLLDAIIEKHKNNDRFMVAVVWEPEMCWNVELYFGDGSVFGPVFGESFCEAVSEIAWEYVSKRMA